MSDSGLLDWMTQNSRPGLRWKVMGERGKKVLAYNVMDPSWGSPSLREALRVAAREAAPKRAEERT